MTSLSSIARGRFEGRAYALWFAVSIGVLFAVHELWLMYATHAYTRLIPGTHEIVHIDDSAVTVINGVSDLPTRSARYEAARLAYAKTIARRQPLFSLEGTDLKTLLRALNELEAGENGLVRLQNTDLEKVRVAALYDTDLIRAAAATEQARRDFLSEGSAFALAQYTRSQTHFMSRYQKGLEIFEREFHASVPEDSKSYATARHVITRDSMVATLEILVRRGKEASTKLSRDRLCYAGFVLLCRDIPLPVVTTTPKDTITESSRTRSHEARELYTHMRSVNTPLGITIVADESTCVDSRYAQPLFALREYGTIFLPLATTTRITHIGNIRLVETARAQDVPFFALYHKKNIPYAPVFEFNFYSCPIMDDDVARIFATQLVQERIVADPFSALLGGQSELTDLESRLRGEEIYETDARQYVQTALEIARRIDARLVNEILPYALMLEKRTAGYERMVADIALMTHSQLGRVERDMPAALDPTSLYMFRNGLVPLFFGSNGTFGTEKITFPAKPDSLKEPYVYLSELRDSGIPLSSIIESVHRYYEHAQ